MPAARPGGIQHGLDARLADPLDGSVRAQHARERRCRVGPERPVRSEQRLGSVHLGRQHDHGQSRALGEPERRRLEVGVSVQDDRPDGGIAGAPEREVEAVARRLGTSARRVSMAIVPGGSAVSEADSSSSATRSSSVEDGPPTWRAPSGSSAATSAATVAIGGHCAPGTTNTQI